MPTSGLRLQTIRHCSKTHLNNLFWRFDIAACRQRKYATPFSLPGCLNLQMGGPSVTPPLPAIVLATASKPDQAWGSPACSGKPPQCLCQSEALLAGSHPLSHDAQTRCHLPGPFYHHRTHQALTMINGEFVNDSALTFAERIRKQGAILCRIKSNTGYHCFFPPARA